MAKVFLKNVTNTTEDYIVLSSAAQVYGATAGMETVKILDAYALDANNLVTIDGNVEKIVLGGAPEDVQFSASGNVVSIYKYSASTATLIGKVTVQDDSDGTAVAFVGGNSTVTTTLSIVPKTGGFDVKVGAQTLSSTPIAYTSSTASTPVTNHAPTIGGVPESAAAVTTGEAADLANFTVADADEEDTLTVTLTATNGVLNGLTDADTQKDGIQLTGTAFAINTALASATFTATADGAASIGISVTDGIVTTPTTATYSLTASTPVVNHAPTISGVPTTSQKIGVHTAVLANFTVADTDEEDTLTVTLTATNGTLGGLTDADTQTDGIQLTGKATAINTALAGATFTTTLEADGNASIGISVTDGIVTTPTTAIYNLTVDAIAPQFSWITDALPAINVTSNEDGWAGLYRYNSTTTNWNAISQDTELTANTSALVNVSAQTSLTPTALLVFDAVDNIKAELATIWLGTTGADNIVAATTGDAMFGFGGGDTFTLKAGFTDAINAIVGFKATETGNDTIQFGGTATAWTTSVDGWTITNGVATKTNATVNDFFTAFYSATGGAGEVVAFEYDGNTYLFGEGVSNADDDNTAVILDGTAGITAVGTSAAANTIVIA